MDVDASLVMAVVKTESDFNPLALSPRGAVGLMQLMPETAEWIAKKENIVSRNLFDSETNLMLGTAYLKYLMERFGSETLAVIAYNAGEGNLKRWISEGREEIPFAETRFYLKKVMLAKKVYSYLLK